MKACLLFGSELYALPILRPLASAARQRGIRVAWVVTDAIAERLHADEQRLTSLKAVRQFAPDAVFCATNWVPPALPGVKVQVFHGFSTDKRSRERGHFRIRGFFDLYCTQGPDTTQRFQELAAEHRHFVVMETGWPKLDPLYWPDPPGMDLRPDGEQRPIVMYGATFTESLSSAPAMLETLRQLIARGDRYWLLTLHPKCGASLFKAYQDMAAQYPNNAKFVDSEHLLSMLRTADVLVGDTSSVVHEFAVQAKPVVTLRNRKPKDFMIDVDTPGAVDAAVGYALQKPTELMTKLQANAAAIHPYRDGQSSERVLDASIRVASGVCPVAKRKPSNLVRRWKARQAVKLLLPG